MNPFEGITYGEDKLRVLADMDWKTVDFEVIAQMLNDVADEMSDMRERERKSSV